MDDFGLPLAAVYEVKYYNNGGYEIVFKNKDGIQIVKLSADHLESSDVQSNCHVSVNRDLIKRSSRNTVESNEDKELKRPETESTEKIVVENYDCTRTDTGTIVTCPAENVLQIRDTSGGISSNRSISPHNLDDHISDSESKSDDDQYEKEDDADSNSDSSECSWIAFDIKYIEFHREIVERYGALQEHMHEKKLKKPKGEKTQLLIYKEQDGTIKHKFFLNKAQALEWSYENKTTMEQYLPVILTTNRYNSSQSRKMEEPVEKAVVGRERSPNVKASLRVPYGTSESNLKDFFIDTAADGGSVGYDCKVLQSFIFSMEEIENEVMPVVFGQISTKNRDSKEIQSFDIDRDPNWNALGMEQIKHFHSMYHCVEKDITVLLNQDDVLIKDCGTYIEIVICIDKMIWFHTGELSHPELESTNDNLPTGATRNPSCLDVSDDVSSGQTGVADANSLGATSNPSSSENGASLLPNERVSSEIVADTYSVVTSADNTFNVEVNSRSSPSAAGPTLSEITESLSNATMIPDCN